MNADTRSRREASDGGFSHFLYGALAALIAAIPVAIFLLWLAPSE